MFPKNGNLLDKRILDKAEEYDKILKSGANITDKSEFY